MPWSDLKKGRYSQENGIYFITFVTDNRQLIFKNYQAALTFCPLIKYSESQKNCSWLSWVLMPDHFHGLLQLNNNTRLSDIIKALKSKSAVEINRNIGRKGQLWQHAYYDHGVRKEENLKAIARYIVANPLRAKIVSKIGDYPFWNSVYL